MPLRSGSLTLLALLTALGSCKPRPASPAAPTDAEAQPAASANPQTGPQTESPTGPDLEFLDHLDTSHTTIVHVGDPVPHLQRLLGSELLERITRDPAILAVQSGEPFGLDKARDGLSKIERWIPASFVVGADDSAYAMFIRLSRVALLLELCEGAFTAGGKSIREELPGLQAQLVTDLEATQVPSMVLWARMRGPQEAAQAFDTFAKVTETMPPSMGVERTSSAVTFSFALDSVVDPDLLVPILVGTHVLTSPDDPMAGPIVDALLRPRGMVSLARHGSALVLELGPTLPAQHSPPTREALGSLFDPEAPQMALWAHWDVTSSRELAAETTALLEQWHDTPAGRAMQAADDNDFTGSIFDLEDVVASSMLRGQARMDVGTSVEIETIGEAPTAATRIDQTPVPDFIPADPAWAGINGTLGLGAALAAYMGSIEDRLDREELKALFKGEDKDKNLRDSVREAITRAYYTKLTRIRELVLDEGPALFAPPVAYVIPRSASVPTMTLRRTKTKNQSAKNQSAKNQSIPIPTLELAFIGKPVQMAKAKAWLETLYQEIVRASFALSDRRAPRKLRLSSKQDLGLGVPTRGFNLGWLGRLVPGVRIESKPGFGFHYFEHGEYLVLSTSARLSREILRSDDPAMALPRASLSSYGRLDADATAELLVAFLTAFQPNNKEFVARIEAIGVVIRGIREMAWESWDEGSIRHSSFTMHFAEP
ncbi:MAG: hypothetical protein AAGF11_28950 [Myxococcota bacterium]